MWLGHERKSSPPWATSSPFPLPRSICHLTYRYRQTTNTTDKQTMTNPPRPLCDCNKPAYENTVTADTQDFGRKLGATCATSVGGNRSSTLLIRPILEVRKLLHDRKSLQVLSVDRRSVCERCRRVTNNPATSTCRYPYRPTWCTTQSKPIHVI